MRKLVLVIFLASWFSGCGSDGGSSSESNSSENLVSDIRENIEDTKQKNENVE